MQKGYIVEHDRLTFRVSSSKKKDIEHLVDLEANDGHGECSCEHFTYRLSSRIHKAKQEKTFTKYDQAFMCKHICIARATLLNHILNKLVGKSQ